MDIPIQLIALSLPSLIYIVVRKLRGEKWGQILEKLGWRGCRPIYLLWGLGVLALGAGLTWLTPWLVPPDILHDPKLSTLYYAGWTRSITSFLLIWLREAIYVALGEEIFFRGLLGGWLIRRFGFAIGNSVQALIFLLPHLLLLTVSLSLWPLLIAQLAAGWLLGWLRYSSGSILPGWLVHSLSNAFGALAITT
jgi:membrane protease YdiL (CAAX protease family)